MSSNGEGYVGCAFIGFWIVGALLSFALAIAVIYVLFKFGASL